jgi:hypothetical protein
MGMEIPDIASNLAEKPHDIGRAARHSEPVRSFVEVVLAGCKLIVVSKGFAIVRHRSQNGVV